MLLAQQSSLYGFPSPSSSSPSSPSLSISLNPLASNLSHSQQQHAFIQRFSTPQLDRLIQTTVDRHLSSDALQSHLSSTTNPKDAPYPLAAAQSYAEVCTLLWRALLDSQKERELILHIQVLSAIWASGKYHAPDSKFFNSPNDIGAVGTDIVRSNEVQARLRSPAFQSALSAATQQLFVEPSEEQTTLSIHAHLSSWAYLCGYSMYQLLQWNHQLTHSRLRELFA